MKIGLFTSQCIEKRDRKNVQVEQDKLGENTIYEVFMPCGNQ